MGHLNNLGFSSQLMSAIADCRAKVEEWVEREKAAADDMERKYLATLSAEQGTIHALEEDLLALKLQLGINIKEEANLGSADGIKQRQEKLLEEREQIEEAITKLKTERDIREGIVKRLEKEEEKEQARAAEVRAKKQFAEESKNTTVEDLTKGIVNYKYLGLDFEKAENQKLRFCFSQIDPHEPSRRFWFVLGANEYDFYEIDECRPPIDQDTEARLLAQLNSDDDLGQFVLKMRCAFVDLV